MFLLICSLLFSLSPSASLFQQNNLQQNLLKPSTEPPIKQEANQTQLICEFLRSLQEVLSEKRPPWREIHQKALRIDSGLNDKSLPHPVMLSNFLLQIKDRSPSILLQDYKKIFDDLSNPQSRQQVSMALFIKFHILFIRLYPIINKLTLPYCKEPIDFSFLSCPPQSILEKTQHFLAQIHKRDDIYIDVISFENCPPYLQAIQDPQLKDTIETGNFNFICAPHASLENHFFLFFNEKRIQKELQSLDETPYFTSHITALVQQVEKKATAISPDDFLSSIKKEILLRVKDFSFMSDLTLQVIPKERSKDFLSSATAKQMMDPDKWVDSYKQKCKAFYFPLIDWSSEGKPHKWSFVIVISDFLIEQRNRITESNRTIVINEAVDFFVTKAKEAILDYDLPPSLQNNSYWNLIDSSDFDDRLKYCPESFHVLYPLDFRLQLERIFAIELRDARKTTPSFPKVILRPSAHVHCYHLTEQQKDVILTRDFTIQWFQDPKQKGQYLIYMDPEKISRIMETNSTFFKDTIQRFFSEILAHQQPDTLSLLTGGTSKPTSQSDPISILNQRISRILKTHKEANIGKGHTFFQGHIEITPCFQLPEQSNDSQHTLIYSDSSCLQFVRDNSRQDQYILYVNLEALENKTSKNPYYLDVELICFVNQTLSTNQTHHPQTFESQISHSHSTEDTNNATPSHSTEDTNNATPSHNSDHLTSPLKLTFLDILKSQQQSLTNFPEVTLCLVSDAHSSPLSNIQKDIIINVRFVIDWFKNPQQKNQYFIYIDPNKIAKKLQEQPTFFEDEIHSFLEEIHTDYQVSIDLQADDITTELQSTFPAILKEYQQLYCDFPKVTLCIPSDAHSSSHSSSLSDIDKRIILSEGFSISWFRNKKNKGQYFIYVSPSKIVKVLHEEPTFFRDRIQLILKRIHTDYQLPINTPTPEPQSSNTQMSASVIGVQAKDVVLDDEKMSSLLDAVEQKKNTLYKDNSKYLTTSNNSLIQIISLQQAKENPALQPHLNPNLIFQNIEVNQGEKSIYYIVVSPKAHWFLEQTDPKLNGDDKIIAFETALMNELLQVQMKVQLQVDLQTLHGTHSLKLHLEYVSWIQSILWMSQKRKCLASSLNDLICQFYEKISDQWTGSESFTFSSSIGSVLHTLHETELDSTDFLSEGLHQALERLESQDKVKNAYATLLTETAHWVSTSV